MHLSLTVQYMLYIEESTCNTYMPLLFNSVKNIYIFEVSISTTRPLTNQRLLKVEDHYEVSYRCDVRFSRGSVHRINFSFPNCSTWRSL
jgi:hypothetical protein